MGLHALSCECRRPDGSVFAFGENGAYNVGISRPGVGISRPITGGQVVVDNGDSLVFYANLLKMVKRVPITTVKSIPHKGSC